MDANQTRFQLVFGQADWFGAGASGSPPAAALEWRASDSTVALPQKAYLFQLPAGAPQLGAANRRGAAQDRFGNYYWIGPAQNEILFLAYQQTAPASFWTPAQQPEPATKPGSFSPVSPRVPRSYTMGGLTVTTDHYLLAGLIEPAGLLLFDLYSGAPPLEFHWPMGVPFAPFDMAAAPGGGAWILDRINRCYWGLDAHFGVLAPDASAAAPVSAGAFQPASGGAAALPTCDAAETITAAQAMPLAAQDPIGITALPDGSVLILDSPPSAGYSTLSRYRMRDLEGAAIALNQLDVGNPAPYPLLGHDLAFVPAATQAAGGISGTLYVADSYGAQTFTFAYSTSSAAWATEPLPQFYPMLRYGGKGLTTGPSGVSYDFDQRWTPLAQQPRARFQESGVWQLPQRDSDPTIQAPFLAFDGRGPGCVWHRLMFDGTIPPGAEVLVESRAADSRSLVANAPWNAEPQPYLRCTGSELPYYKPTLNCCNAQTGTWELLFQAARGRYLQLRLTFTGNGRATPRIQAVRAYYPRFSYLTHYLPSVYRDNAPSASFLERFLANVEGTFTALEGRIQQAQELFDGRTAPAEFLPWLASWIGVSFDFTWGEPLQRFFLENAKRFYQTRGTPDGIVRMIRMALDQCADDSLFAPADAQHFSVRIVENFQLRAAPGVTTGIALGDPTAAAAPTAIASGSQWTPAQGPAALDQLFRTFLSNEYASIAALNQAWGTSYAGFTDAALRFPGVQPMQPAQAADWSTFTASDIGFTYAVVTAADLPAYQSFLMQQYQQPTDLNTAYGLTGAAALSTFGDVASKLWSVLAGGLPSGAFLEDWIQFVSVTLPTQRNAHQFTVTVPVQLQDSLATQTQRLNVAQRITQQEKPAHTSFNVKLYWAAFCAGLARVGIETVVGPSSRFAALLLDQGLLGESNLGFVPPWNVRGRMVAGRDQLRFRIPCGGSAI